MKKFAMSGIIGWDVTAADVREALHQANGEDVEVVISSPGGLVSTGLEIYNLIRNYPGHTTAILSGYAMSMASYIPLAFDKVKAEDNAVYMIHNARGGVWGDHNDIISYGAYVKGLSGLLAKQYAKTTGKTLDEITGMMDKETFFFGEEMVEAGFVHEIISTGKNDDKDQNVALAMAVFMDTMAKLGKESAQMREDMNKASAIMGIAIAAPTTGASTPAPAGTTNKEVQQMSLAKLLADNPAAKAEYDAAISGARADGEAAGKKSMQDTISAVSPYLANAEYPPAIATTALKVLKGDESAVVLRAAVAAVDAVKEQANLKGAGAGQGADVAPAAGPDAKDEGKPVSTQAELDAEIARAKKGE